MVDGRCKRNIGHRQLIRILLFLLLGAFVQAQNATSAGNGTSTNTTRPLGTRAVFGLPKDGMQVNSIYVGVLPDWSKESPIDINKALGKSIALIGDYIYIGSPNSYNPFGQMPYHAPDAIRLRGSSIYAPAVIPSFPLSQWTSGLSTQLASTCATLNQKGLTVWLRFAVSAHSNLPNLINFKYEMNGFWMQYGLSPSDYLAAWNSVWSAIQANSGANQTYLLWSPNVNYGDTGSTQGYSQYYPGDDKVDIAGLSFYYSGEDKMYNSMPDSSEFTNGFDSFYKLYGHKKPVVISETSAPYHYQIPASYSQNGWDTEVYQIPPLSSLTPMPSTGGPDELAVKSAWMQQMTSEKVAGRYPNLTAVCEYLQLSLLMCSSYFKEGNNSNFNDFRAITGASNVESWFRSYCGNVTAYQGGFTGAASSLHGQSRILILAWTFVVFLFII